MRLALTAFILSLLALTARAEDWQSYSDDRGYGAFVCPTGVHPSGQRLCFELYCTAKGAPVQWHLVLSGYDLAHGPQPLAIAVDGRYRAALLLEGTRRANDLSLTLDFSEEAHGPLVRALARGAKGALHVGAGAEQISQPMSLNGSSKALRQVLPLCAADGHRPMAVPDQAVAGDYVLGPDDVRHQLIGREISWRNDSGRAVTTYHANGQYDGILESDGTARATTGSWWLIDTGNVCWKSGAATGCFQFRHEDRVIRAYRVDGGVDLLLGEVVIGP